jgi:hypothetical protein
VGGGSGQGLPWLRGALRERAIFRPSSRGPSNTDRSGGYLGRPGPRERLAAFKARRQERRRELARDLSISTSVFITTAPNTRRPTANDRAHTAVHPSRRSGPAGRSRPWKGKSAHAPDCSRSVHSGSSQVQKRWRASGLRNPPFFDGTCRSVSCEHGRRPAFPRFIMPVTRYPRHLLGRRRPAFVTP